MESLPRLQKPIKDSFLDIEIDPLAFLTMVELEQLERARKGKAVVTLLDGKYASDSKEKTKWIDERTKEAPTLYVDMTQYSQVPPIDDDNWEYYLQNFASDIDDVYMGLDNLSDRSPKGIPVVNLYYVL